MRKVGGSRRKHVDLLVGAPREDDPDDARVTRYLIDPEDQLAELADLAKRGLMSPEEHQRQRRKVMGCPEG